MQKKYRNLTITKCNLVKVFTKDYLRYFLYSILMKSNYSLHNSQVNYAKACIVVVCVESDEVLQAHSPAMKHKKTVANIFQ